MCKNIYIYMCVCVKNIYFVFTGFDSLGSEMSNPIGFFSTALLGSAVGGQNDQGVFERHLGWPDMLDLHSATIRYLALKVRSVPETMRPFESVKCPSSKTCNLGESVINRNPKDVVLQRLLLLKTKDCQLFDSGVVIKLDKKSLLDVILAVGLHLGAS